MLGAIGDVLLWFLLSGGFACGFVFGGFGGFVIWVWGSVIVTLGLGLLAAFLAEVW